MKQFIDFFPILVFVAVYFSTKDMILATAVLIASSALQIILDWLIWKKADKTHLITFAVLLVLGGATIVLQDETFVKWKPTAVYWIFSCVLLGSHFFGERNLVQIMLSALLNTVSNANTDANADTNGETQNNANETDEEKQAAEIIVPQSLWIKLNFAWILFFVSLGFVNIWVAYNFDTDTWVTFKLVGVTGANLVFFMAQMPFLFKYLPKEESES